MTVQKSIEIINGKYLASIALDTTAPQPLTVEEKEAIQMFGAPSIDVGGVISTSLTLPVKFVRVPAGFPIKQVFNTAADADAWLTEIINRLTTAIINLRAQRASAALSVKYEVLTI